MSRATPQLRNFARRLTAYETLGNTPSGTKPPSGFHVCEKLRPHLATLMSHGGIRTLLARAVALSTEEVPWLRAVRVKEDWSLEGLEDFQAQLDPEEFFEGRVVLVAQLLGLLVAFIGEILTLRLVCEVWPEVPIKDLNFGKGGKKVDRSASDTVGKRNGV